METEQEKAQRHLSVMQSHADSINAIVSAQQKDEEKIQSVQCSIRVLGIMLKRNYIQNCGTDLTGFHAAVTAGTDFLTA